jgi:hypothetical protein
VRDRANEAQRSCGKDGNIEDLGLGDRGAERPKVCRVLS